MDPEYAKYKMEMLRAAKPLPEDLRLIAEKLGVRHFFSCDPYVRQIQDMLQKHMPKWEEPPATGYLEYLWNQISSLAGEEEGLRIIKQCINLTLEKKPRGAPSDSPHMRYFCGAMRVQIKRWSGE